MKKREREREREWEQDVVRTSQKISDSGDMGKLERESFTIPTIKSALVTLELTIDGLQLKSILFLADPVEDSFKETMEKGRI